MKKDFDAIIVTMSEDVALGSFGSWKALFSCWAACNMVDWWFYHNIHNIPRDQDWQKVGTVFWVVGGRIRYKSLPLMIAPAEPPGKSASLVSCDFEPIPKPNQVRAKGFRGFRYALAEDCVLK